MFKQDFLLLLLLFPHLWVSGFVELTSEVRPKALVSSTKYDSCSFRSHFQASKKAFDVVSSASGSRREVSYAPSIQQSLLLPILTLLTTARFPAPSIAATTGAVIPSALWAYAHFGSILVILGCLASEKTLVKAGMTEQDENMVVKLDVLYGVMAALLIISGLFRATDVRH